MNAKGHGPYLRLAAMAVASFACMYVLMYAMVDSAANVHHNLNQVYMAALMTAPMLVLELVLMGSMYARKRLNLVLAVASLAVLGLCWFLIRQQAAISDRQFLRSMIPHHAGALLMCERADLEDPEVEALCRSIRASQRSEIDWMTAKLEKLDE